MQQEISGEVVDHVTASCPVTQNAIMKQLKLVLICQTYHKKITWALLVTYTVVVLVVLVIVLVIIVCIK